MDDSLKKAIAVIGGPSRVAELFDISPQAVCKWDRAPAERVLGLEEATRERGAAVTRNELRPDIFGPAQASGA